MDLENTPAMEAPPGETSNLVNPLSLKDTRIVVSSISLGVVTVFVAIRIYVRLMMKKFNSEDWMLLFASASFIVLETMLMIVSLYGDGKHIWDVSVASLYNTLFYENIAEIMYCVSMFSIKYVVLHQVKSIFFEHDRRNLFRQIIIILIWMNLLLYTALGLAFVFACTPREKIYHPHIEGRCINTVACMSAGGALNIASDLSILVIPMFGISRLQMPLKRKIQVGSVFAIGIFATAAATVRFYYGLQLFYTEDSTWGFMPVGNWTTVEFMMGFIVAGAPYTPRLVEKLFGRKKPAPTYPPYKISSYGGTKNIRTMNRPDASWTALREQEEIPFDGSLKTTHTGNTHRTS